MCPLSVDPTGLVNGHGTLGTGEFNQAVSQGGREVELKPNFFCRDGRERASGRQPESTFPDLILNEAAARSRYAAEEVAGWLYYLVKERELSASSVNVAVNAASPRASPLSVA